MPIIKESLKRLWNTEQTRTLVMVSLCMQFGLVFLSPLRKRTGQKLIILVLWFFYLFADYVAILALGNLLRRQSEATCCHHGGVGLMAFWAPFLLLHLGGPDTITSYSIEHNELWWRHFLGLAIQVVIAFMVLLELVVIPRLRVAAFFVFIAGLVKYSERTWALRSSRPGQLRNSYVVQKHDRMRSRTVGQGNIHITQAYKFYEIFKPFLVDHRLSRSILVNSRGRFVSGGQWKAFKTVEIELSFLYDVLHTKTVLFNGLRGCIWRFISLGMIASSFVLFLKSEKSGYEKVDTIISYILFCSALFMELISLLLIITSDWMIIALKEKDHCLIKNLAVNIAKVLSCFFTKGKPRWSNSMGQYSLLSFSLRNKKTIFRWILDAVKVKELWDNFIYIRSIRVPCELKELLFEELKTKTEDARPGFKKLGDFKLMEVLSEEKFSSRVPLRMMEFGEIILLWHIATDLCFHSHSAMNENPETRRSRNDNNSHSNREISLVMSNYMMYLLIMQSSMMPVRIEAIRVSQNIYTEAKNFFRVVGKGLTKELEREKPIKKVDYLRRYPETMSQSFELLSDACNLARELNELAENKRWRLLSRVWVEMLCYAAINCKTYYHSKQLSQGGELLTHVMLLMVHMGIPQKTPTWMDICRDNFLLYN